MFLDTHMLLWQLLRVIERGDRDKALQTLAEFRIAVRHGLLEVFVVDGCGDGARLDAHQREGLS